MDFTVLFSSRLYMYAFIVKSNVLKFRFDAL